MNGQSHNVGGGHTRFLTKLTVKMASCDSPSNEPATCKFRQPGELE